MGLFLFVVRIESHFMNHKQYSSDKSLQDFYKRVSSKISTGFIVKERNDKLPFAILSKKRKKVNHNFNFLISCLTFGLWSLPWFYLSFVSNKEKVILIAIDEDGNPFEDKCFN